jgi:hypothetical protein
MKLLARILAFLPGPVVSWFTGYMDLLVNVGIAHPHWSETANNLALAIALVVVLLTALYLSRYPEHGTHVAFASGILFLGAMAACWLLKNATDAAATADAIERFKEYWMIAYVSMAVLFAEAIGATIAALLLHDNQGQQAKP